jgi:hypothetical protein
LPGYIQYDWVYSMWLGIFNVTGYIQCDWVYLM